MSAAKGEALMEEGHRALNKRFRMFSNKWEEAVDPFGRAANVFKMAKEWARAGAAYKQQALCHVNLDSKHEAATALVAAANCFKKVDVNEAISALRGAIEYYTDEGRFNIAAKHQKTLAELFEAEGDVAGALEAYQTAADFYDGEGTTSSANQCKLKVAAFAAQAGDFARAIEIFEEVGTNCLDNNLLKWNAKEYFLRAGICHLCMDDVQSAKRALDRYRELDVSFASQRESSFLEAMIVAVEGYDPDAFTVAVRDYDELKKLDAWKTNLLLQIKNAIAPEDDLT